MLFCTFPIFSEIFLDCTAQCGAVQSEAVGFEIPELCVFVMAVGFCIPFPTAGICYQVPVDFKFFSFLLLGGTLGFGFKFQKTGTMKELHIFSPIFCRYCMLPNVLQQKEKGGISRPM